MFITKEPDQPKEWPFIDDLKSSRHTAIQWDRTEVTEKEVDLRNGVVLDCRIPDEGGLLNTTLNDFQEFLNSGGIPSGETYKIIIRKHLLRKALESYRIEIGNDCCLISVDDIEGGRRALYFLQDEIKRSGGPFLTLGITEREPMIKIRISRCFFGPIKRPPMNRDELADDVDYYPDEYLNRLASEGINGLWITAAFGDLYPSEFFPGVAKESGKRLKKLKQTALKCARYGIRIYLFCIEPVGFSETPRASYFSTDYLEINPEFKGHQKSEKKEDRVVFFCTSSDKAKKYLEDSAYHIFSNVPELGGLIDINLDERCTHCYSMAENFFKCNCPSCSQHQPWEVFSDVTSALSKGMRRANPQAKMISWLYNGATYDSVESSIDAKFEVIKQIASNIPKDVILQLNFESNGQVMQLGRERIALDYWLSWPGPSEIFKECARLVVDSGGGMSAKIQVGCSHEVATVPFIPVPGNLYKKYQSMRDLGVTSVMQCWYFGNYPGLMNKAAGELSFYPFPESENDFLLSLARIDWGRDAGKVSRAWEFFQQSYSNFPVNLQFTHYGPLHHSVVWPLHLIPVDQPISPSWKFTFPMVSGDRIGECICFSHTLDEVLILLRRMDEFWSAGLKIIETLESLYLNNQERLNDISLYKALGIQINSTLNVFTFYDLREKLPQLSNATQLQTLSEMEIIVKREIQNSLNLKLLCEKDSRLGFHSEAEGYKYFPEKLDWRAGLLQDLIQNDFPAVFKMIQEEEALFPSYTGANPEGPVCLCHKNEVRPADYRISEGAAFQTWWDHENICFSFKLEDQAAQFDQISIDLEPRRLWPTLTFRVFSTGEMWHIPTGLTEMDHRWNASISADAGNKLVDFRIPWICFRADNERETPFRFNLTIKLADKREISWVEKHPWESRLTLGLNNPEDLSWIQLK